MNPLYIAHVVADFLLQPNRLAAWKEKRFAGVLAHAGIHGVVMGIFLWPRSAKLFAAVILIAALHAIIDQLKISYQKNRVSFSSGFLVDQVAHFSVLTVAAMLFPFQISFWLTTPGKGILALLFFFSFTLGLWHLVHIKKYPLHSTKDLSKRIAVIAAAFCLYLLGANLFV